MPLYEYVCNKCGREFEELVFGNDIPPCPECGAAETRKMMSRCARHKGGDGDMDFGAPVSGGGCGGCSGGNCASCGH